MLNATHVFSLDAKGYRVYVRGNYAEQDITPYTAVTTPKMANRVWPDNQLHDLSGRPVSAPSRPGIYIRDGKKIIYNH